MFINDRPLATPAERLHNLNSNINELQRILEDIRHDLEAMEDYADPTEAEDCLDQAEEALDQAGSIIFRAESSLR